MKRMLIKFALAILRHYGYGVFAVSQEMNDLIKASGILIDSVEIKHSGNSGEYKRHQVYSELIKKYPTIAERNLALAIELAIQGK